MNETIEKEENAIETVDETSENVSEVKKPEVRLEVKKFERPTYPSSQLIFDENSWNFNIINKRPDYYSMITPFINNDEKIDSGIVVPSTCCHRVFNFYNLGPKIVSFEIDGFEIKMNTLKFINSSRDAFFPRGSGYAHLTVKVIKKYDTKPQITFEVDDRIVFLNEKEPQTRKIERIRMKEGFKIKQKKAFYFELNAGFGVAFGTRDEAILYLTLLNPSKLLVGYTNQSQINRIMNNAFSLFPIFNTNTDANYNSVVLLKNLPGVRSFLNDLGQRPVMVKITYPHDSDECYITHLATKAEVE